MHTDHPPQPPESPPDSVSVDVQLRRWSWEAYSVTVATVVGLLSLTVSAYTAYTLHLQTRAQVFPYVQFIDLGEAHRVGVFNKGTGPAFVRAMRVEIDGHPVRTWRAFFDAAKVVIHGPFGYSNVNGMAIAANETLPAIVFGDAVEFRAYQAIDPQRYRIDLCYCSVLDECWRIRAGGDTLATPVPVPTCTADSQAEFTQ
jgi:hypothetical protein